MVLNQSENRVYVLNLKDGKQSILSYNLDFIGNVAPVRALEGDSLEQVENFTINHTSQELILVGPLGLRFFNLHSDKNGPLPEHSPNMKRSITGALTQISSPKAVAYLSGKYYILEQNNILIFDQLLIKNTPPIDSRESARLSQAVSLTVDSSANRILAIYVDGSTESFNP